MYRQKKGLVNKSLVALGAIYTRRQLNDWESRVLSGKDGLQRRTEKSLTVTAT